MFWRICRAYEEHNNGLFIKSIYVIIKLRRRLKVEYKTMKLGTNKNECMHNIHVNNELGKIHRYHLASKVATEKVVLDVACGKGYGSSILAKTAYRVIGVSHPIEAIRHAREIHKQDNLEFMLGSCYEIPLPDASVDLVVCFDAIEYYDQHEKIMDEIKRVLNPGGVLLISSPDKYNYSMESVYNNELHVKELYKHEFSKLVQSYFCNVVYYGQRIVYGSGVFSEECLLEVTNYYSENGVVQEAKGLVRPDYWIAVASNSNLPVISSGLLEQSIADTELFAFWKAEIDSRDENICELKTVVDDTSSKIEELDRILQDNDRQILYRDRQITYRDQQILERDKVITLKDDRISKLEEQIVDIQHQFDSIQMSNMWRLTLPLRKLIILLRRFVDIFHTKTKSIDSDNNVEDSTKTGSVSLQLSNINLPIADGVWEWSEYYETKNNIKKIKNQRKMDFIPEHLELIDISKETLDAVIRQIKLPTIADNPHVSIILPVFNNLKLTLECLLSICMHTDSSISYEVIVADDASEDNTYSIIEKIPNIRLITSDNNIGFLRNCNRALEYVNGKYILFLNNDVQVTEGWLDALLITFESQSNVGAVGPRFVYPSGHLQEAGASFRADTTADMVGLNEDPSLPSYNYIRRVDYVSGACLLMLTSLVKKLGGFSEDYLPCYCEDSDLCLRVQDAGYHVYYNPSAIIIHHLSKTTDTIDASFKLRSISKNTVTFKNKWYEKLDSFIIPKVIAFYLPQFYPFPENNKWWGSGFTEWSNVTKAKPNFIGHYQPRLPADLGFYDLRITEVMEQQADLAEKYGIYGFCYYYYWFNGKRLLDYPVEQMLATGKPKIPFCLCWANENWTRRWDGQENEILMGQAHSEEDDNLVISDLIRFFEDQRYIRIDGHPLIIVYRVTLFPDFAETANRWRKLCRDKGIGEIYIAMVESFDLVNANRHPNEFGCDAAVEFPPQGQAEIKQASGEIINSEFTGNVADYRDLATKCATRDGPAYTRFRGVCPGWDNTARRQNSSFCFEHSNPGVFQAWLEESIEQTRRMNYRDEKLVFINAWNEWAEGAYLEPDRRFGHAYLEAVKNALEASRLLRKNKYGLED